MCMGVREQGIPSVCMCVHGCACVRIRTGSAAARHRPQGGVSAVRTCCSRAPREGATPRRSMMAAASPPPPALSPMPGDKGNIKQTQRVTTHTLEERGVSWQRTVEERGVSRTGFLLPIPILLVPRRRPRAIHDAEAGRVPVCAAHPGSGTSRSCARPATCKRCIFR